MCDRGVCVITAMGLWARSRLTEAAGCRPSPRHQEAVASRRWCPQTQEQKLLVGTLIAIRAGQATAMPFLDTQLV